MARRFLIGLLKGLLVGLALGLLFHVGLGWRVTEGLLGYLISMGSGATAGVIAGRPPWRHEAWLESLLKAVFGIAVAAALYWVLVRFASFGMPFGFFGAPEDVAWTSLPLLYAPLISAFFGLIIELDNDTGATSKKKSDKPKKTSTSQDTVRPAASET